MSESNLSGFPRLVEVVESVAARAVIVGSVLPRAVLSSRAAARRSEESGIPAWTLGARQFTETATDEFFIAASSLIREVPALAAVEAAVERCETAAPTLLELGVAGANVHPGRLRLLGLRPKRWMGTAYEHLEYESRPLFPEVLTELGHGRVEVAHARVLRHAGAPRPWVVCLHGAEQGRADDLFTFRARHLHETLGLNVAMPVLPQHGPRRELGASWPGFNLLGNVATMMRAVSDVRALLGWIEEEGSTGTSVIGMSLGGPVAALTAGLDDRVEAVAALVPMLDAHATVAHHLVRGGRRGRHLATLLRSEPVTQCGTVVDPTVLTPHAAADRRLVIAALNDRMTSVQAAQRLHRAWGGAVHWHPGGHVGHIFAGGVHAALDDFLAVRPAPAPDLATR